MTDPALIELARANDTVLVADPDHADPAVSQAILDQLPALAAVGVKHLYLEHDAKDVTLEQLRAQPGPYGELVRRAEALGMQIHLYDDRSEARALAARYPQEAALAHRYDPYFEQPDLLVAAAPDAARMREFIAAKREQLDNNAARNARIVANISADLDRYPGEKAVVLLGAKHLEGTCDVDEGLRLAGHQVVTVEINSPDSFLSAPRGPDKPDVIIATESGRTVFKDPITQSMRYLADTAQLPWRNTEPVAHVPPAELVAPAASPHEAEPSPAGVKR